MRLGLRFFAMTALVAMAVVLAACGSSSSSSSSSSASGSSTTAASTSSSGLSAATQQAVDAAYKGTFQPPPSSAPKPQAGKNIWVIQQSAQVTDLSAPGQIVDAAKLMGWHLNLFDGKYDPSTWVSGIRQAIAAKADGIILFAIDCAPVKAALQDAKKANIPVVGWEDTDCNQTVSPTGALKASGQPGLFSAAISYPDPTDPSKQVSFDQMLISGFSATQAVGLAAGTKGKGKVIKLKETDASSTLLVDYGFDQGLKKYCPGCQVVDTIDFVGTDVGSKLQDKVAQALTQHPDANAVYNPYGLISQSSGPAVVASGRKDQIFVMGGEGNPAEIQMVHEGRGVNAGAGYSVDWEAWAALDAMNRLLHGQKPAGVGFPSGLGYQLFDKDHNLAPQGMPYQPPIDFRAAYKKAWGVG